MINFVTASITQKIMPFIKKITNNMKEQSSLISLFLTFQIRFKADPSGTHFWHSHTGFQRADGVVGSLVIREPHDPHSALYDDDLPDHVVLVQDWLIEMTLNRFTGNHHSDSDNKPKSALINGNCQTIVEPPSSNYFLSFGLTLKRTNKEIVLYFS